MSWLMRVKSIEESKHKIRSSLILFKKKGPSERSRYSLKAHQPHSHLAASAAARVAARQWVYGDNAWRRRLLSIAPFLRLQPGCVGKDM